MAKKTQKKLTMPETVVVFKNTEPDNEYMAVYEESELECIGNGEVVGVYQLVGLRKVNVETKLVDGV